MHLSRTREVFAVPGSIRNPMKRGCHGLLREGAGLVEHVEDIFAALDQFRNLTEVLICRRLIRAPKQ